MSDVDVRTIPGVESDGHRPVTFHAETALHYACEFGQQQMAKALLDRGASRMSRENWQGTPLHHGALSGHLSCVLLLIGRPGKMRMTPAEVDARNIHGRTSLHHAAEGGFEKVCGVLLAAGAQLDARSNDGFTPLMIALQFHPTNLALHTLLAGGGHAAQLPGTVCDHCGKTAEQANVKLLKVCGSCHGMRFCDAACQKAGWPGHKAACKARVKEREEAKPYKPTYFPSSSP
jgi:Ankyrin repeats (3 copies)/MYND finger/Ankyrin repeats (many copies)